MRRHNEGSIRERKPGQWEARITLPDGRRHSLYGKTYKAVYDQLIDKQNDIRRGLPVITERQTVEHFLTQWLDDTVKPSVRPRTYESYHQIVHAHIVPTLGKIDLMKLTPQHIQKLMGEKAAAGLSPTTVGYIRRVLRIALGKAVKWNLVARNVASLVDAPRKQQHEISPLSPQQARTLLDSVRGDRLEALYTVAVALGLRKGEALGLRWQDVNLDTGTLSVRFQLQRIDGAMQLVEPKTARSRRTVQMPPITVDALRRHKVRQLEERLIAGSRWHDMALVFSTPIGTPLDSANVTHAFHAALQRAALPRQRFHDLRHTCASLLLAQGVEPRAIMETLGHSQISITLDLYSHLYPEMRQDVADRMEALLTVAK